MKGMFYFGYDNYMKYAFPEDELNPIDCQGRRSQPVSIGLEPIW